MSAAPIPAGSPRPADPLEGAAPVALRIEPMRRRHLRGVLRVEAHNEHRPWSLGLFMSELRMGEARVYAVALVDQRVVGFAGELFSGDDAHVTTIAVHPDWRRRGIGARLLHVLADQAVRRGMTALTLEVRAGNEAAQALYRRFGFEAAGVRRNYYSDLGEDAVIMWASDIGSAAYAERLESIAASDGPATTVTGWR